MVDFKAINDVINNLDRANLDCLLKRRPSEPMFIVLGRDPDGGFITRLWAQRRFDAGDTEHANAVFPIADEMDAWASTHKPESAPPREAYDELPKVSNTLIETDQGNIRNNHLHNPKGLFLKDSGIKTEEKALEESLSDDSELLAYLTIFREARTAFIQKPGESISEVDRRCFEVLKKHFVLR